MPPLQPFDIDIPGGWKEEVVTLGDRTFQLLIPADPDWFLENLSEDVNHDWADPYWAKLWPTAIELARLVVAANWPADCRIVELGCGIGLPGLAALSRGWQVTFSDYISLAMEVAQANAVRNGYPAARQLRIDWRNPPQLEFDVILASDVLYDRSLHAPLLNTLAALSAPDSRIFLGEPGRSAAEDFLPTARARGWKVVIHDQTWQIVERLPFNQYSCLELTRDSR